MSINLSIPTLPSSRMFLDKVVLQFPSSFLDGEQYRLYAEGDLTILRWGNTIQVLIHDERLRNYSLPAEACFRALWELALDRVFVPMVAHDIQQACWSFIFGWLPWRADESHLLSGFKFVGLELTIDLPGIDEIGRFDLDRFNRRWKTTFYTKDRKRYRRGPGSARAGELKRTQDSFVKFYRKDLQVGLKYPVYRLEWAYSGKYRRFLKTELLYLQLDGVYRNLLPSLARLSKDLGLLDAVDFSPAAMLTPNSLLGQVFRDLQSHAESEEATEGGAY